MVKRIKSPFDLQQVLLRSSPTELALLLVNRWGPEQAIDELDELLFGDEPWRSRRVAIQAARVLALLDEDLVVDEFLERSQADDAADDERIGTLIFAIGQHGSIATVLRLLDHLDNIELESGHPPGWTLVLDALVSCGERGLRHERCWVWLERLRNHDAELWCCFAGSYGDSRAVSHLYALIDHAILEATNSPMQRVIIDGVDSLELLGAARPTDLEALAQVRKEFLIASR
jgi:hypothetical protein